MSDPIGDTLPFVTVILPIRNEEQFIERCLGAVLAQDYPPEWMEILIGDGMSEDDTRAIIEAMPGAERVQIIPNPRRIQAAAMNITLSYAKGDYVLRIDGHTIIAPDYVRRCVEHLQRTGAYNVGGAMNPVGVTPMGKAIAAAGKSAFAVPSAFHVSSQAAFTDTVYMGAFPRQVLVQVGGYNEHVGVNEDYELNVRLRRAGGTIYFAPDIQSLYYGRQTLTALARQYFRYGRSKVQTLREHPSSLRPRQIIAPAFVAGIASVPLLALFAPALLPVWGGVVLLYVVLTVIVSFRLAAAQGWALFGRLLLVFPTIHLAWGCGFWVGVIRPFRR